jgi:hypothetical protein
MKKKIIIFSVAAIVIVVAACFLIVAAVKTPVSPGIQQELASPELMKRAPSPEPMMVDKDVSAPDIDFAREKIIKEGSLHLRTDNVKESSQEIHNLVEQFDAYIQRSTFEERDETQVARFSLRVQSEQFDELISSLSEIGHVEKTNVSTQDVTEEYIDLQARLTVLQAQEERLLQMYEQAENIEEFLMFNAGKRACSPAGKYRKNAGKTELSGESHIIFICPGISGAEKSGHPSAGKHHRGFLL